MEAGDGCPATLQPCCKSRQRDHLIRSVSVPTARLRPRPALGGVTPPPSPLLRKKKPFDLLQSIDQATFMT